MRSEQCKVCPVVIGTDFDVPSGAKLQEYENGKLECDAGLVGTYLKTQYVSFCFFRDLF